MEVDPLSHRPAAQDSEEVIEEKFVIYLSSILLCFSLYGPGPLNLSKAIKVNFTDGQTNRQSDYYRAPT